MSVAWIVDQRVGSGPVVDQGMRPTCLSCATSSAHHAVAGQAMSIEFLHYGSRQKTDGIGQFTSVRRTLLDDGQPPEVQWPYNAGIDDLSSTPPPLIPGPFVHSEYEVENDPSGDLLVEQLKLGLLPVVGLITTPAFMRLTTSALTEPDVHLGRHAVLLVGAATYMGRSTSSLNNGDILMCVKNSWGPSWGNNGFALVGPRAWADMILVSATLQNVKPRSNRSI